jgi:hypothetical protein
LNYDADFLIVSEDGSRGTMRWVAEVVEVPWICDFAALAPPTAWTANAAMSKQEKMMIYDIGLKYAFAFPTIIVLTSETNIEWFT